MLQAPLAELLDDRLAEVVDQADQLPNVLGHALGCLQLLGDHFEAGADVVCVLQRFDHDRRSGPVLHREKPPTPRFALTRQLIAT